MREPARIARISAKLARVWGRYPDMRLGQLYINLMGEGQIDPWQLEDDAVEKELDDFMARDGFRGSRV